MYTFKVNGKTQWLDHTANHLAVACIVELEVAPAEQLRLKADLDVDLDEVILLATRSINGKVHAIWGEIAPAPVGGTENLFYETDCALPGKVVDRGVVSKVQRLAD